MDLDLQWVASLLVLIEEGHYGRAAARLYLSSSALSKQVHRLERQLGVTLLERGPTGVLGVTQAGQRFATAARPLLAQAKAAQEAARTEPQTPLRLGIPAGATLRRGERAAIETRLRHEHPRMHLVVSWVPFVRMTSCLVEQQVDVLWTATAVDHPGIESTPIAGLDRVGLVGVGHELAAVSEIDVERFCDLAMGYNPAVPPEWMRPFFLGDLRPAREARLVELDANDHLSVLRQVSRGAVVTATIGELPLAMRSRVHSLRLIGVPPMMTHAAHRRSDHRAAVQVLVQALRAAAPANGIDA